MIKLQDVFSGEFFVFANSRQVEYFTERYENPQNLIEIIDIVD